MVSGAIRVLRMTFPNALIDLRQSSGMVSTSVQHRGCRTLNFSGSNHDVIKYLLVCSTGSVPSETSGAQRLMKTSRWIIIIKKVICADQLDLPSFTSQSFPAVYIIRALSPKELRFRSSFIVLQKKAIVLYLHSLGRKVNVFLSCTDKLVCLLLRYFYDIRYIEVTVHNVTSANARPCNTT